MKAIIYVVSLPLAALLGFGVHRGSHDRAWASPDTFAFHSTEPAGFHDFGCLVAVLMLGYFSALEDPREGPPLETSVFNPASHRPNFKSRLHQ